MPSHPERVRKNYDRNAKFPFSNGTADWCPYTNSHTHRFKDYGGWVEHRHPVCDLCGYIDRTRELPAMK